MEDEVIKLHEIARKVEEQIGVGQLSRAIREAADKLSDLVKGH